MKEVTRFNPTANGPLHIGHAYTALVNEHLAHSTGGHFVLRFDDNTRYWRQKLAGAAPVSKIAQGQLDDLHWLGIEPDQIVYQTDVETGVKRFLAQSTKWQHVVDHFSHTEWDPVVISDPPINAFGLLSYITAEKVVLDYWERVTTLVRGLELLSEHALYLYFCALLGFDPPRGVYIPRLMAYEGEDLTEVSKTEGNWKIRDLRDRGINPAMVLDTLRASCLVRPSEGWGLDNLKFAPKLPREILCSYEQTNI